MKILVSLLLFLGLSYGLPGYSQSVGKKFLVVQSMHYKSGVDVSAFGIERNPIIYESSLLPSKSSGELAPKGVFDALAANLKRGPLPTVIDIERWSIYTEDDNERTKNRSNLLKVLERLRAARPDILFGYYGVIPARTYWPLVDKKNKSKKQAWDALNEKALIDFAPYVDAIYPSLYTFYEDQEGWKVYAEETLKVARRFGKPVYCYLWPQYHSSNLMLRGKYLPIDYWEMELDTCYKYADGVVIWNYEPDEDWNPNAQWWRRTLEFMKARAIKN